MPKSFARSALIAACRSSLAGADTRMLENGGRLRLTQSAVVLENLISQFLFNKAAEGGDDKSRK